MAPTTTPEDLYSAWRRIHQKEEEAFMDGSINIPKEDVNTEVVPSAGIEPASSDLKFVRSALELRRQ